MVRQIPIIPLQLTCASTNASWKIARKSFGRRRTGGGTWSTSTASPPPSAFIPAAARKPNANCKCTSPSFLLPKLPSTSNSLFPPSSPLLSAPSFPRFPRQSPFAGWRPPIPLTPVPRNKTSKPAMAAEVDRAAALVAGMSMSTSTSTSTAPTSMPTSSCMEVAGDPCPRAEQGREESQPPQMEMEQPKAERRYAARVPESLSFGRKGRRPTARGRGGPPQRPTLEAATRGNRRGKPRARGRGHPARGSGQQAHEHENDHVRKMA